MKKSMFALVLLAFAAHFFGSIPRTSVRRIC